MAQPTIPRFLKCLGESQLLTAAQFQLLRKQLEGNPLTAEGLAQVLVRQNHLTEWQANQLLKGQTGFVLNQYRLLNPIGRGGMGHVFRGLDVSTNSVVAVKVMARRLATNETLVSRFRREIRASSELDCPNIVRTLDAGRVGRVDFMVMEFVNGDQVDRIASRLGRLPIGLACEITKQIATGLQHAHEHQMVHRDIKPSNMMVHWDDSGRGIAKLMDMGLVLVMNDEQENSVTRTGQVMGTPDYMSPEQGWDTTQVDIRSDIYSLGCTLFRLLTGTIPFTGSNPVQVLSQRLQRDAPSVRTVCEDIPDEVANIVSKMTLRDPEARYQTPEEVVAALKSFSKPLRKKSFQTAARRATNDPKADFSEPRGEEVDESDGTYQRFLSEVDKGSVVDLMLTTDVAADMQAPTVPVLDINLEVDTPPVHKRSRPRAQRGQRSGFIVLGIAAVLLLLIAAATLFSNGEGEDATSNDSDGTDAPSAVLVPTGTLAEPNSTSVTTGDTWTYEANPETSDISGTVELEVGDTAPVGVTLDDAASRVSWNVPVNQSVGEYTIPLKLVHVMNDERQVLDERDFKVQVTYGMARIRLPEAPPQELDAGIPFEKSLAVDSDVSRHFDLRYGLSGNVPNGLKIDRQSGILSWTPTRADVGRYIVNVGVSLPGGSERIDGLRLILLVLPTSVDHVLPPLEKQTVEAGRTLEFRFPQMDLSGLSRIGSRRRIEFASPPPDGMVISPDRSSLVWKVPKDASGVVRVSFRASMDMGAARRRRELAGTSALDIEIRPPASPPPASTLPAADEIARALEELRDTYKSRLAAARSLPQKTSLAWQLMDLTYEADAGAADAALLELIESDLGAKARAIDVLLEVAAVRAARYGTDELAAAAEIIPLYRRTSLDSAREDLVAEHALRLAIAAVETENYQLTDDLMKLVDSLFRGSSNQGAAGQLAEDVAAAGKFAAELAEQSGTATDDIKSRELSRLLTRWQFQPVFRDGSNLSHFGVTAAGTGSVNGRDLWKFEKGSIRLEAPMRQASVGFLDQTNRDRFVVRLDMMPGTTSAQVIIGASGTGDQDFKALGIVLDSTGPGRIISIRSRSTVADPSVAARLYTDQTNRIEVVVDGQNVAVRINGITTTGTQIPELEEGRIGIAANLGSPEPKVLLRNVRILELPDMR